MTPSDTPARKRGRPTEAERAVRRDEILDAAVRLFGAEGFARVTLDRVAAEARVTKRTIYNFFGGRDEIFIAAVERLRTRVLDLGEGDFESVGDLSGRIVHVLHSDEAVALHRIVISESHGYPEFAAQFYEDGPAAYIRVLARALPGDDIERAELLFALLLGEAHRQRLLGLRPAPDASESAAYARRALAGIGLFAHGASPGEDGVV